MVLVFRSLESLRGDKPRHREDRNAQRNHSPSINGAVMQKSGSSAPGWGGGIGEPVFSEPSGAHLVSLSSTHLEMERRVLQKEVRSISGVRDIFPFILSCGLSKCVCFILMADNINILLHIGE